MRAFRLRHGENSPARLYDMHDSRAPCVEQFVHYRRTTEENGGAAGASIFPFKPASTPCSGPAFPGPPRRL